MILESAKTRKEMARAFWETAMKSKKQSGSYMDFEKGHYPWQSFESGDQTRMYSKCKTALRYGLLRESANNKADPIKVLGDSALLDLELAKRYITELEEMSWKLSR